MKNRYGDQYTFEQLDDNTYIIAGELKYWRFGGKEGQQQIDMDDLGMVDPSGGPYIAVGMQLFGREIKKIWATDVTDNTSNVYLKVE